MAEGSKRKGQKLTEEREEKGKKGEGVKEIKIEMKARTRGKG